MAVKKSELYSMLWEACNKLRGGVEPARYKDYVLILLFHKYVSDRYKGKHYGMFTVTPETSFDKLIEAKGKTDIGQRVDDILKKFKDDNQLEGALPDVHFNNTDELGAGKELVDKVSGLISVFQNPAIDFRNNRASDDDIIGDAYEYFMMKFAQESGKSKGQFYTPSEVSRVIARLIGIGEIQAVPDYSWTIYDPAAGSGSLLIRAADEAPTRNGDSLVTIYGQEKDHSTAGLARMNLIVHHKGTSDIQKGNSLTDPKFLDKLEQLQQFDFVVMNPPFSDKSWSDGLKADSDKYHRFDGFGIPPEKNGDYAWFLHVIKSLNPHGKAGIVMPHGVLFRGNSEETIRRAVLSTRYIKGIVSLPPNLFYGTGIPACLVFIDKENSDTREGIFFIDASSGFRKDGSKNRLREQDIEKIVRVYISQKEIKGYSRMVSSSEILEDNGGNMNVPRYIQRTDDTLPQNIAAHISGGIPQYDIESLSQLWRVSPELKRAIFTCTDENNGIYNLAALSPDDIDGVVQADSLLQRQRIKEGSELFGKWCGSVRPLLLNITKGTNPKELIRKIGSMLLDIYSEAVLMDCYNVYDCLMNYWNEKMQDDIYILMDRGWEEGRRIDYQYAKKKAKDSDGRTITVDDESRIKSFDGELIPREVIEREYFRAEADAIEALTDKIECINAGIEELRGEDEELTPETLGIISEKEEQIRNLSRNARKLRGELDDAVKAKYKVLSVEDVKRLLLDGKWFYRLSGSINAELDRVMNYYVSRVVMIARRYGHSLIEIEADAAESNEAVRSALKGMGYTW
mgnify:CR=1 FL=1